MPASNTPSTSPVVEPGVVTWWPEYIVTDGPPVVSNPNPGPGGNGSHDPKFHMPAWAQPQGPNVRQIVPVPGTLYGDVAESSMSLVTGPSLEPCYPPEQNVYEFPVYYPGVGWVSSASKSSKVPGT